jgi:hypothetical protein
MRSAERKQGRDRRSRPGSYIVRSVVKVGGYWRRDWNLLNGAMMVEMMVDK